MRIKQIIRFLLVGGVTAVFYYSVLYGLVEFANMGILFSSSAAYIAAMVVNYNLHYAWTFDASISHNVATIRYVLMSCGGFFINYLVMFFGIGDDQGNYLVVQTLAITCVVMWNFILSSVWVYRT